MRLSRRASYVTTIGGAVLLVTSLAVAASSLNPQTKEREETPRQGKVEKPTEGCQGTVREVRARDGSVRRHLLCDGRCEDGSRCTPQSSTNHHGGTREWCGCEGVSEPRTCHAAIVTPGRGEGGGPQVVVCAGGGCEPLDCVYREESQGTIQTQDGAEVVYINCSCK